MKVCIVQPLYSADYERSEELFQWQLDAMDKCDDSMDLIVTTTTHAAALSDLLPGRETEIEEYEQLAGMIDSLILKH